MQNKPHHLRTLILATALMHGLAQAHITLEQKQAQAGSYYKAVFKVGHGCAGSATQEIAVPIPPGVQAVKPMPKAGWEIALEKRQLSVPYLSHGKPITEEVSLVRWQGGRLADAYFDEFILQVKLPEQPVTLYWPVTQICETGRIDWVEVPSKSRTVDSAPAPYLQVIEKPTTKTEKHQH